LGQAGFLSGVSQEDLTDLAAGARLESRRQGEQIYPAAAGGEALYVLRKGAVELETAGGDRVIVQAPAFFGEEALTGEPRVDTARVREPADLVVIAGTAGYMHLEHWRPLEALYMTVITITTVGFNEVHPLHSEGRVFTMALTLVGVFTLFYAATAAIRAIVSGEVRGDIGRQRMEHTLQDLRDHVIVCGFGRMGRFVCAELSAAGHPFVAVDKHAAALEGFQMPHGIALAGDATSDHVLRKAGIDRARVLSSLAAADADNLYITMSARLLNDKIFIVARAEDQATQKKLLRAGANRVVA